MTQSCRRCQPESASSDLQWPASWSQDGQTLRTSLLWLRTDIHALPACLQFSQFLSQTADSSEPSRQVVTQGTEDGPASGTLGTDLAKACQAGRPQEESRGLSVGSFSLSSLGTPSLWSLSRHLQKTCACHPVPNPGCSSLGLDHSGPQQSHLPQTKSPAGTSSFGGIHNVVLNVPVACLSPKVLPTPAPTHNILILSKSQPDSGQRQKSVSSPNGLMGTVDLYLASWDHSY